jgi:thioredoxin 1
VALAERGGKEMAGFFKSLFGREEMAPAAAELVAGTEVNASNAEPIHVTDDTFQALVLDSSRPTLVDFWAPWCGPCRMVAPIVEELARKYDGQAVIAKINTDESARIAADLGIMGIPTLILFKEGHEVNRVVGYAPRHALEDLLDGALS